jgi:hypothetical protein
VTLLTPGAGRAQGAAVPARGLTAEQLDSFVELTGDPKPLVWQRLLADPGLVPFAAAAANARLERRASGKTMTIVGFTILGVGAGAGYGLLFWGLTQGMNCDYASSCKPNESLMLGGVVLMVASIATGCAIGIPGIIRMVRPSEAETEASSRYQTPGLPPMPAYPTSYSQASWLRLAGRPISAPILSYTF